MKTSLIASIKGVQVKDRDMLIITTVDNDIIWVPKKSFDTNAETITFEHKPIGSPFKTKEGVDAVTKVASNVFVGYGIQRITKFNAKELLDHMAAKGMSNALQLS